LKIIGYNLKNLGPYQKTLRYPWCPKIVTGLIGHSLKIWAPLRKLFAPLLCPAGYGPGKNRLMDWLFWRIIVIWQRSLGGCRGVVQKETQTEFNLLVVLAGTLW